MVYHLLYTEAKWPQYGSLWDLNAYKSQLTRWTESHLIGGMWTQPGSGVDTASTKSAHRLITEWR